MAALRWDQTPEFLAASNTTLVPGGPTAYLVPRPTGISPQDVTDFHPGQANWSLNNLPNILYTLNSPRVRNDWKTVTRRPREKRDQAGQIMYERWPEAGTVARPLLDFKVLPDRVGTKESWWVMEAWRRLDPRITWPDIVVRMERASTTDKKAANNLNMGATRVRSKFGLITWHSRGNGKKMTDLRDAVLSRLSQTQIANNTTRGLTPGLINPALGEAGGRVPLPGEDDEGDEEQGNEEGQGDDELKGNDEKQAHFEDQGNDEEASPAPRDTARGPPCGIFHPVTRAPGNIMKRKRNDTPEQADNGDHDRKKLRTMAPFARQYDMPETAYGGKDGRTTSRTNAPPARREVSRIPRAEPVQHYDADAVEDFARYGINVSKRKHDDSQAVVEPRKRARRAMADDVEYIPAPSRGTASSIRRTGPRDENTEFINRLDPALFAAPANPVANEPKQAAALVRTETRRNVQIDRRCMARPALRAHLPGARAQNNKVTRRQDQTEATAAPRADLLRAVAQNTTDIRRQDRGQARTAPPEHLPGARVPNTTETRLHDLLEAREAPRAHLPRARAPATTHTMLQDHDEAESMWRGQRAHLAGVRTRNTDTPATRHPGRTEAPGAHLPGARAPSIAEPRSLGQARREAVLAQLLGASAQNATDTRNSGPGEAATARELPRAHLPGARTQGTAETRHLAQAETSSMPREVAQPYLEIPRALDVPVQVDYISVYHDAVAARRHTARQQGHQELEQDAPNWAVGDYFDENAWRNEDGTGDLTNFDWTDGSVNLIASGRYSSGSVPSITTFSSGNCYATYAGSAVGMAQGSNWYEDWLQDA